MWDQRLLFQKDVKSIRLRPENFDKAIDFMFQKDVKSIRLRPFKLGE